MGASNRFPRFSFLDIPQLGSRRKKVTHDTDVVYESMKRIYTLLFAAMLAGQAWAEDFDFSAVCGTGQTLYYKITSNKEPYTVAVTSPYESYSDNYTGYTTPKGDLVIPTEVENDGVTYTVTGIGNYAFQCCTGLTTVTIPNSVEYIRWFAFEGCSDLTSVTIPESVTDIGWYAFKKCSRLTSVNIPNKVDAIAYEMFYGCSGLTSITIPESVTRINCRAFAGCSSLTSVTIPNSVTFIEGEAFSDCWGLTKAEFSSIASLCKINFEYYDANPLYYANHLYINGVEITEIVIPDSVESIGNCAFSGSGITTITIPNSVTKIGYYAFSSCHKLASVIIPNSVTSIGSNAFYYCDTLSSIVIPESVTTIEDETFQWCCNLSFVDIPNSITKIGESAFYYSGLKSVEIPNSVTEIGDYAFTNVKNIVYSGEATGSPWGALTVNGIIDNGFVYSDAEKTNLTAYIGDEENVVIPDAVTRIGSEAFIYCRNIKTVTIPITVTEIGVFAFNACTATIYCEASSRPFGWDSWWNSDCPVVWTDHTPVTESAANAVNIYAYGRNIVVENAAEEIRVYNAMGALVGRDVASNVCTVTINNSGVYIVKTGNTVKKVMVN